MKILKTFEEYIKEDIIRKDKIDNERAKSMVAESERKMRSMLLNLEKVGINPDNASDYAEQCYDILMFLIRAKLYSEGYSSSGKGSHEAELSYLRLLNISEKEVLLMNELRYLRNGILYYGKPIDEEYAEKVIKFTKQMQPKLKKIATEKLKW
jgi:hypothetical protein